ncbi:MAG: hypothetical protein JXA91_06955 [Candidatus Thermoplasmatota archaeon]|nr:hypothetical protein [Candidatus Thermoplasmatota archaeon]
MVKNKGKILGRKDNDPEWIRKVAYYFESSKGDKYKNQLRELFMDYIRDGMRPEVAWKKAQKVLDSFDFGKE